MPVGFGMGRAEAAATASGDGEEEAKGCRTPSEMSDTGEDHAVPPAPRKRRRRPFPSPRPPKELFVSPELDDFFAARHKPFQN